MMYLWQGYKIILQNDIVTGIRSHDTSAPFDPFDLTS